MTTVRIYKSSLADARVVVKWRRRHGMPRGRGRRAWRLRYRERFFPEALRDVENRQLGSTG